MQSTMQFASRLQRATHARRCSVVAFVTVVAVALPSGSACEPDRLAGFRDVLVTGRSGVDAEAGATPATITGSGARSVDGREFAVESAALAANEGAGAVICATCACVVSPAMLREE
jgi:hypothetical protein